MGLIPEEMSTKQKVMGVAAVVLLGVAGYMIYSQVAGESGTPSQPGAVGTTTAGPTTTPKTSGATGTTDQGATSASPAAPNQKPRTSTGPQRMAPGAK